MRSEPIALGLVAGAAAVLIFYARRRQRQPMITASFFLSEVADSLPHACAAWEAVARSLPTLNRNGRLRAAVEGIPPFRVDELTLPELRRARVILGFLVTSLINGHGVPWDRLEAIPNMQHRFAYQRPPSRAAPSAAPATTDAATPEATEPYTLPATLATAWAAVSARLGLPPILTATDLDLWNRGATPIAGLSPREALTAFRQSVSLTGTESERGFHALPFALQLVLAPLLPRLLEVPSLCAAADVACMTNLCIALREAIDDARALLPFVYTGVDVDEFYDVYRPLLSGWSPRGLRLPLLRPDASSLSADGSQAAVGEVTSLHGGPSAGQTAIIMLIDLALGVQHGPQLTSFQHAMREYLPSEHRDLIVGFAARVADHGSLLTAVQRAGGAASGSACFAAAHAAAIESLGAMRAYHYGIATHFLKRSLKGTGGSDFRAMLDEGVQSTKRAAGACAAGDKAEVEEGRAVERDASAVGPSRTSERYRGRCDLKR